VCKKKVISQLNPMLWPFVGDYHQMVTQYNSVENIEGNIEEKQTALNVICSF